MKVLIDLTSLADNFSGIERYAACLAKEMIQDVSSSFVLVFKEGIHPIFQDDIDRDNVEAIVLERCNKLIFNQVRLPNAIRKIKADYYLFLAFPAPILLLKKNMVSTIHDICCWDCPETMNGLSSVYFKLSHRVAMMKCKRIITISEFSKKRIVEKLHYSPDRIWLIYCGIEKKLLSFQDDDSRKDEIKKKYNLPDRFILSLSTLEPRKNLQLLLQAYSHYYAQLPDALPLVLAGRKGWKVDHLLDPIDPQVRNSIYFTGFVEDADLPIVYRSAEYFVFPSKYEGFGMPPLEALACGTKVLSSDSSSLPEVLGEAVAYFESENMDSLLQEMLKGPFKPDSEIITNQIRKFDWANEAKKLLENMRCGQ